MKKEGKKIYWKYLRNQFKLIKLKNLDYVGEEDCIVIDKYIINNTTKASTSNYGYILNLQSCETGYLGFHRVNSKNYNKSKKGQIYKKMGIIKSHQKNIIAFSNNKDEIEAKKEVQKEARKIILQLFIALLVGISVLYWIFSDFILNIKLF